MTPVEFKSCVVEKTHDGEIFIALMDGADGTPLAGQQCVAILACDRTAAASLHKNVGSVLND